jgi:hypothetical protein
LGRNRCPDHGLFNRRAPGSLGDLVLGLQFLGLSMKHLLIFSLALTFTSLSAHAADRRAKKPNCEVSLTKEAGAGSIFISFEADSQEECDRAKAPEVKTDYSGPVPAPSPQAAAPAKTK